MTDRPPERIGDALALLRRQCYYREAEFIEEELDL